MPFRLGPYLAQSPIGMGALGAIVSGSSAAAKNAELLRKGTVSQSEALLDVSNEALKSAVVSAATSVIVLSVGGELALSLGLTLLIGTTGKYFWNRGKETASEKIKLRGKKLLPVASPDQILLKA